MGKVVRGKDEVSVLLVMLFLASTIPSVPGGAQVLWPPLTESNSWIEDIPTVWDFLPFGVVHQLVNNTIKTTPDPQWGLQCFIYVGRGESRDGRELIIQGILPIKGATWNRIWFNGKWHYIRTVSPMYYDNGTLFPYNVTVYTLGEERGSISYDARGEKRRWIFRLVNERKNITLDVIGYAKGIPYWMGKPEGPYLIHGAYWSRPDFDVWGGFFDTGVFNATLVTRDGTYHFRGHFLFDRAYHRSYYEPPPSGAPLSFTCLFIFNDEFHLRMCHSDNPSPLEPPVKFQHQGRINFLKTGQSFRFDDYEFTDDGSIQPRSYHVKGKFEGGELDLYGRAYMFWPQVWGKGRNVWWDPKGVRTWGRAFIRWKGEIKLGNRTMEVEAHGIGEFTRYKTTAKCCVGISVDGKGYAVPETDCNPGEEANVVISLLNCDDAGELVDLYIDKPPNWVLEIEAEPSRPRVLPDLRVAVLYERVVDRMHIHLNRTVDDVIQILKETDTDFILRGWWRWSPMPERCEDLPPPDDQRCEMAGYSYEHLREALSKIKSEIPDVVFCGAIPAQRITRKVVWNPITWEVYEYPDTWEMALDPGKWGIPISKEEFQCWWAKEQYWLPEDFDCTNYDPQEVSAYFPDITNEEFQELLLSWAYKQIDCGVDAIWIDMLFRQALLMYQMTRNFDHIAVKESYNAAAKIVDEIHEYGLNRGKYVYVGTWTPFIYYPYPPPDLDFVTLTPFSKEVREMKLNEHKWNTVISAVRSKLGGIPIIVFIDWAATKETPLGVFSQELSKEEQREFLEILDEFCKERGVVFAYPVHGGHMGMDAEKLSYGLFKVYDSLAPEFQTYDKIKELSSMRSDWKWWDKWIKLGDWNANGVPDFFLGPMDSKEIRVRVKPPRYTPPSRAILSMVAKAEVTELPPDTILIGNKTCSDTTSLETEVMETHGVTISLQNSFSITKGYTLPIQVEVMNCGNVREEVEVGFEKPEFNGSYLHCSISSGTGVLLSDERGPIRTISLLPMESSRMIMNVFAPSDIPSGIYTGSVYAYYSGGRVESEITVLVLENSIDNQPPPGFTYGGEGKQIGKKRRQRTLKFD